MPTLTSIIFLAASSAAPADSLPPILRPEYVAMADSADYYIAREMWDDAKRCTVKALRTDPANFNNAMLFSNLGVINLNLGLTDEAIANFSLGLSIAPASSTLRANRARAYLATGEYAPAANDLRQFVESNPDDPWALKMLGVTLVAIGRPEEGVTYLNRIPEPDPDTLRLLASLALTKGDTEAARGFYDRLVADSPSEESWYDRALFLISISELQAATDDIREGLKMYPRAGNLVLLRAYIHSLMHENSLAEMDRLLAIEYGADAEIVERLMPAKKRKK